MMKPFMMINLILFIFSILCCVLIRNFTTLLLFVLCSLPTLVLNCWLVPGGFAWRNYTTKMTSCERRDGPVGLPLLGTLPQMMGSLAHRKLAVMASSLGAQRLMPLSLGSTRVVISSHPETAKEILCSSNFSDRPIKESARLLMFERAVGFAPSGDHWRHLRRLAATHLFSPKKISALEPIRHRLAEEMARKIEESSKMHGVVELRGIIQKGSLGNMLESLFGSCLSEEQKYELGLMVNEGYELITKFNLEDHFPMVRFLDIYGVKRKCQNLAVRVQSLLGQILKERREGSHGDDFLTSLISLSEEDQLADADVISVLWEMMFRGTDTVAILLEWIMARLVLHQDVQANLRREIVTCVGDHRHVRDSDVPKLRYLHAVVKEVLRLHPPGPLLSWARLAVHDVHVDKFLVPAGTTAMVNMWAITHDPTVWKNPWAFRPSRFLEDDDVLIMGSDLRLAPFGSGRRVCPGKALGLATVHLWVARLLQRFDWLPAEPVDLSENLRMSLEMKKPLKCQVRTRVRY
ncbi:PREDICTED: cytochrome P450 78A5-like [Tarenaya hassleriana]|uniref:cytochrome P450 78A5-like n=1 Tax=Tarenaya hassleriana TaxID=28532 RepID=UPI00053C4693|nr:PREDICTED: cytochrome P450 78A5-like [Tarenaya hassleriana]